MIASAYAYADGGAASNEIRLSRLIGRYGVEAIMGRPYLGYGEIMRIHAAENVVNLYAEMKKHSDWAEFKQRNPDGGAFLFGAMKLAHDMGLIDG